MIKLENYEVTGWEHAIRGMRNPMNSWEKIDSRMCGGMGCENCEHQVLSVPMIDNETPCFLSFCKMPVKIGENDHSLMMRLRNAGVDHRKYMRMITVYVDITAPLYWWKEFDTYKVGTVANSCSTMHKIHTKPFGREDFSCDRMSEKALACLDNVIDVLEETRLEFVETKERAHWDDLIQLLPSSYNQKRTVMLNYEVLANMYPSRKNHKLPEWHVFCDWIESLPCSEIITGTRNEENDD